MPKPFPTTYDTKMEVSIAHRAEGLTALEPVQPYNDHSSGPQLNN